MNNRKIINYWIEKANEDIASARDNHTANRLQNAVRDAYFACFHAFSAVLFKEGKSFRKHKEVRSTLHRYYIKSGRIAVGWGKHYDWLFDNRQKADYRPLVKFQEDQVSEIIKKSTEFVAGMIDLLKD